MVNEQEKQLKEMCTIMINLLYKLRLEGKITDAEYNEHIKIKKQYLENNYDPVKK